MRVLFLTHQYFPRHIGGTEVYTRGLVRALVASGHQAEVLTCHEDSSPTTADFRVERSEYEAVPLVEVHFNLSACEHPARAEYDNEFAAQAVRDELASFRPDIVHVLHGMKLSGSAILACVEAGLPIVVTLCDYWFLCPRHTLLRPDGGVCVGPATPTRCADCVRDLHGFAPRPVDDATTRAWMRDLLAIRQRADFLRSTLLQTDRIVALSGFQKRMFISNGYPAERIEVIPHGLDLLTAECRDAGTSRPLRRLGFVGTLVPQKGAHTLLAALQQAPELAVECHIHGAFPEGRAYGQELRRLADGDPRVRFAGPFVPEELAEVLLGLDLLALPASWYENEPLVAKAALHLGVPVLASRLGSLEDLFAHRGPEWLLPPNDSTAWAAALRRLAPLPLPTFEPVPQKSMRENVREMVAVYQNVLGGPR